MKIDIEAHTHELNGGEEIHNNKKMSIHVKMYVCYIYIKAPYRSLIAVLYTF